jgi:methylmalonyl-CoA epimerase
MIKGINHVGFVVKSIDSVLEFLKRAYNAKEIGRHEFPELGQVSCLVQIGDGKFELMEPLGDVGVVPKFLKTNGEGFHHISLVSDNLEKDCEKLESQGVKIIGKSYEGPFKVAFTHPKSSKGIIYEIAESE